MNDAFKRQQQLQQQRNNQQRLNDWSRKISEDNAKRARESQEWARKQHQESAKRAQKTHLDFVEKSRKASREAASKPRPKLSIKENRYKISKQEPRRSFWERLLSIFE